MTEHKITADFYAEWTYSNMPQVEEGDTITIVPERKVVDLSKVVGTRIPMLFGDADAWEHGYLHKYRPANDWPYLSTRDMIFKKCSFDTSPEAWVSWGPHVPWYTGNCPLPKGVEYQIMTTGLFECKGNFEEDEWEWVRHSVAPETIIAFRVTGLKDGWVYPWEAEQ